MSRQSNNQSDFYNRGYEELKSQGGLGFPDLKIVDGNVETANKKILSIGGGNGADLYYLTNKNEIYLVDISKKGVEVASQNNIQAQVADLNKDLPFVDNSFDIIILKDILEHIYDPSNLVKEAKRLIKKDGEIIISLPNHFYFPFRLRILLGGNLIWKSLLHNHKKLFNEWDYMHIRFFTWKGVKKFLKSHNLVIAKVYWDFGTLAHYSDPLMYEYAFKINKKTIITKKQFIMYRILLPLYKVLNIFFPRKIRNFIVSIAPGLLCAGFYLRVKKYE